MSLFGASLNTCTTCGASHSSCGCRQSQSTDTTQSLPRPAIPCDPYSGVPVTNCDITALHWSGPNVEVNGERIVTTGDRLDKIINVLIQKLYA